MMAGRSPSAGRHETTDAPYRTPIDATPRESRQQHALRYLESFDYPVELRTLSTHVAATERGVPVEAVSDTERERVAIRLHHVDIPRLASDGVVAYDTESRMVLRSDGSNVLWGRADAESDSRGADAA